MDYEAELNKIVKENPNNVLPRFLNILKSLFQDFIAGKVSDVMVSDLTVFWYVGKEQFSDALIKINPKIQDLSIAMDITHPKYSKKKKIDIIRGLIKEIDGMFQN